MGSFGVGNFDNDDALDVRNDFIKQILNCIRENLDDEHFGVEDCDRVVAYVVILNGILDRTHCSESNPQDGELLSFLKTMGSGVGMSKSKVSEWRERVLEVFDAEIDGLQPASGYKSGRRLAIERAFSELETFANCEDT
jgi:Domain of unknown function (DUF4259)